VTLAAFYWASGYGVSSRASGPTVKEGALDAATALSDSRTTVTNSTDSPLATQFFACDGTALSSAKWAATAAGPFTSPFTNGNVANFAIPHVTGTGGGITVGGINASENFINSV